MTVTLDNLGARVASLSIPELHGKQPHQGELISPDKGGALLLTLNNQDLGKVLWKMEAPDSLVRDNRLRVKDAPVDGQLPPGRPLAATLVRIYTFHPDSLGFRHALNTAVAIESYTLKWPSGLNETEAVNLGKGIGLNSNFFSEVVLDNGVTVDARGLRGQGDLQRGKRPRPLDRPPPQVRGRRAQLRPGDPPQDRGHGQGPRRASPTTIPRNTSSRSRAQEFDEKSLDFDFDILPLSYDQLKAQNQNYEKIIFSGWEWFFRADVWYVGLCGLVLKLLKGFHELIPNWGVAIILLTLLVRFVTFPLTIAQTKAGVRMAQHAPAIQKIRERNKGNNQKASLEIMEYYKKEGINPMAQVMGCFPVLLQMPIFISLFNVLGRSVELKDAPFIGWITDLSTPDVVYSGLRIPFLFPLGITVLAVLHGRHHVLPDEDVHQGSQPEDDGLDDADHDVRLLLLLPLGPGAVLDGVQPLHHRPDLFLHQPPDQERGDRQRRQVHSRPAAASRSSRRGPSRSSPSPPRPDREARSAWRYHRRPVHPGGHLGPGGDPPVGAGLPSGRGGLPGPPGSQAPSHAPCPFPRSAQAIRAAGKSSTASTTSSSPGPAPPPARTCWKSIPTATCSWWSASWTACWRCPPHRVRSGGLAARLWPAPGRPRRIHPPRAWRTDRLDLLQAEAVGELIHAQTLDALRNAQRIASGELARPLRALRDALVDLSVRLELDVDFAEEEADPDYASWLGKVEAIRDALARWPAASSGDGCWRASRGWSCSARPTRASPAW